MRSARKEFLLFAGTIAAACTSAAWAAALYTVVDLGFPDSNSGEAISLNDKGDVVGFFETSLGSETYTRGFLYSGGTLSPLATLGGLRTVALGINNAGVIVGGSWLADQSEYHAVRYTNGSIKDLGTLGGRDSEAWSINDAGEIVGWARVASTNAIHSFRLIDGAMEDLGTFGGVESQARSINATGTITGWSDKPDRTQHAYISDGTAIVDPGTLGTYQRNEAWAINRRGEIVGSSSLANGSFHAFWYSGTSMSDLGTLGDANSEAYGINDAGQIVGWFSYQDKPPHLRAFLYEGGKMFDLNDLIDPTSGWLLMEARDINEHGWIAGRGSFQGGSARGVLLIPISVPEPITLALFGLGLAGIGMLRRKKLAV